MRTPHGHADRQYGDETLRGGLLPARGSEVTIPGSRQRKRQDAHQAVGGQALQGRASVDDVSSAARRIDAAIRVVWSFPLANPVRRAQLA